MIREPSVAPHRCQRCGAAKPHPTQACWLCHAPSEQPSPYQPSTSSNYWVDSSKRRYEMMDYISIGIFGLCGLLTLLVAIGIGMDSPGLLIPFLILVAPAYAMSAGKGFLDWKRTGQTNPANLLVTFIATGAFTIGLLGVLGLAGIVLLFAICLSQLK